MNNVQEIFKTNENLLDNYKNNISTYNSISLSKYDDSVINTNNTNLNNESINTHLRKINSILNRDNYFRNDNNDLFENKNFQTFNNNKTQINIEKIKKKYCVNNNNNINTLNNLEKKSNENNINKQNSFDMNIIDSYNSNIEPILNEIEKIKNKYLNSKNNQKFIQTENQLKILEEKLNKYKIELFKSIEINNNNLFSNKKEFQNQYLFQNRELNKEIFNENHTNKKNNEESKKIDKKILNKHQLKESLNNNETVISFNISEDSEMINSKNLLVKNSIIQRKEDKEFNFDEVLPIINEANLKTIKEDNNENLIETNENFFIQKENRKNEENEKKDNNLIKNKDIKEMDDTKKEVSIIVRNVIETISNKLIENEEKDNNSEKDILELINDNKEKNIIKQPKLISGKNNKQIPQPKLLSKNNNKNFNKIKNKYISFSEYLNQDNQ